MNSEVKIMRFPARSVMRQVGHGIISDAFKKLGRFIMPMLARGHRIIKPAAKEVLKDLGKQAIQAGSKIIMDTAMDKKKPQETIKKRVLEALPVAKATVKRKLKEVGGQVLGDIKSQIGEGASTFPPLTAKKRATEVLFPAQKKKKKNNKKKKKSIFD